MKVSEKIDLKSSFTKKVGQFQAEESDIKRASLLSFFEQT